MGVDGNISPHPPSPCFQCSDGSSEQVKSSFSPNSYSYRLRRNSESLAVEINETIKLYSTWNIFVNARSRLDLKKKKAVKQSACLPNGSYVRF